MLSRLLNAWSRSREARALQRHAIPDELWQLTLLRYPFLALRSAADVAELRRLSSLFLASKEFHGVGGFEVTDEVATAVAAQACLPILRLGLSWYDSFVGIVMHADEVVAQREFIDDDGIVHQYEEALAGEAMDGGPLMLTWTATQAPEFEDGIFNVVIHEFAHVIDMRDGFADGVPPLANHAAREAWIGVIDTEWEAFCARVDSGEATLIDPYGAQSIEEFFAVAVEALFVAPTELQAEQPALYCLLSGFFFQA